MILTSKESTQNVRESADTFGRVPDVPDFDVSSGNSEDKAGSIPETHKGLTHGTAAAGNNAHCCWTHRTDTTLLGWSDRDMISWPVTKFHTLHVRSTNTNQVSKSLLSLIITSQRISDSFNLWILWRAGRLWRLRIKQAWRVPLLYRRTGAWSRGCF